MKITKTQLKQIIKEELENMQEENSGEDQLADDLTGVLDAISPSVNEIGAHMMGDDPDDPMYAVGYSSPGAASMTAIKEILRQVAIAASAREAEGRGVDLGRRASIARRSETMLSELE